MIQPFFYDKIEVMQDIKERMNTDSERKTADENLFPDLLALTASARGSDNFAKAARSLRNKAEELEVAIKVEIHEGIGIKDPLTPEEIEYCKGIIVATDTSVVLKRFAGKQVLVTTTSKAINEPEKLIRMILNNEAPIAETIPDIINDHSSPAETKEAFYTRFLKAVNTFIPFLVATTIMSVFSLLFVNDVSSPASVFFRMAGKTVYELFLPILSAYIAYMIAGKNAAMIGLAGGIIAEKGYSFTWLIDQSTSLYSAGILGAVISGIISGYITRFLERVCSKMSSSSDMIRVNFIYPICGIIAISTVMFALNVILSSINFSFISALESIGINQQIRALVLLLCSICLAVAIPRLMKEK